MFEVSLRFATFDDALPFLRDKNRVNHAVRNSPRGCLIVEIAGEIYKLDKQAISDLSLLEGDTMGESRLEFIGLDGLSVCPDWFPEVSRTALEELIAQDEVAGIPVIVSSFGTGFTYRCNSYCSIPSGLNEESVLRLNNLAYHFPQEYRRYGGGVLEGRGAFSVFNYAAIHAASGQTLRYTVEARAVRIKNVPGLFRYARTLKAPEALSF